MAATALVLLVAFLALSRAIVQIAVPEGGSTAVARLQIGAMELVFIAAVLADPRVFVPRLKSLPPLAFWILLIWFVWSGTAVMAAEIPTIALVRQTEWIVHGLFAWALWAFLSANPDWRAVLPRYFVWGFLVYAVAITFFLSNVPDPDSFPWKGGLLGFRNVRHFSAYAGLALLAAHLPLMRAERPDASEMRRTFIILTITWAFLMWSGSRGAFLAVLAVLIGLTIFRLLPQPKPLWRTTILAGLLGLFISLNFTPPHPSFGILRLASSVQTAETANDLSSNRLTAWGEAIETIAAKPLYGIGPDHYAMASSEKGLGWAYEHPHNAILQAGLAWGVPGALAFVAGIGVLVFYSLRRTRREGSADRRVALGLAGMVLLYSLVSGTLYYGVSMVVLAMALALVLAPEDARQGEKRFDMDIHGLTALAGVVMGVYAAAIAALLWPGTPAPDSLRARLTTAFPAAMTIEEAGEKLDSWAVAWRAAGRENAYDWLKWTAAHSRTPWTSLRTMGDWLVADGFTAEGKRLRADARRQRPEGWDSEAAQAERRRP